MEEQQDQTQQPAPPSEPARPAASTDELAKAKAEAVDYLAGWQRAKADYANLRKEMDKAREELVKYACAGFIGELLPVVDNFKKAAAHQPQFDAAAPPDAAQLKQWAAGVDHIRQQIDAVLKRSGVTAIEETGVGFDPSIHEAMMMKKQEGVAPDQVVQVLEPGYKLHDRVLRPAKVVVSE